MSRIIELPSLAQNLKVIPLTSVARSIPEGWIHYHNEVGATFVEIKASKLYCYYY